MTDRPLDAPAPPRPRPRLGGELVALLGFLALVVGGFSLATPRFLTGANLGSMAFQLPELGLLTLAMLVPILSGGLNLAVTFTANICGLAFAAIVLALGGPEAGGPAVALAVLAALGAGLAIGAATGGIVALTGAHPILVTLAMMIFLRGLGEWLTRGGDISGFPPVMGAIGQGTVLGVPVPLLIFLAVVALWHVVLTRTRAGFSTYMIGSNEPAARYSGIRTGRVIVWIYAMSGLMAAIAGIVMAARFNSVRVGHGESYLLITVLACFLGGVDPFGGFGRVLPVLAALAILQALSSGLNLVGANQHLATAMWGLFLIAVMVLRHLWARARARPPPSRKVRS